MNFTNKLISNFTRLASSKFSQSLYKFSQAKRRIFAFALSLTLLMTMVYQPLILNGNKEDNYTKFSASSIKVSDTGLLYFHDTESHQIHIVGLHHATKLRDGKLIIPGNIDGLKVTQINKKAFLENKGIKEVQLNDGITSIENLAFSNCTKLKKINFPSSLERIALGAFINCEKLKMADLSKTKLRVIHSFTFLNCAEIRTLTLPDELESIDRFAFWNNKRLTHIKNMKNKDLKINPLAFFECERIADTSIYNQTRKYKI